MPTNKLTSANLKYQNIRALKNDQPLLKRLPRTVDIVDRTGTMICRATIQQAGGINKDLRLGSPALFGRPLPASVCPSGHILSVDDIVDWNINAHNQFVLDRVSPATPSLPVATTSTNATPPPPKSKDLRHDEPVLPVQPAPARDTVNFCTQLVNLRLVPVHTLMINNFLVKGGAKKNADLCKSCKKVHQKCLCYYWKCEDKVYYVGSATHYKNQASSLLGRVLNYLQNHTESKRGNDQVNKRVFIGVNKLLAKQQVEFGVIEFDFITIRDRTLSFKACSENPDVIGMLEYALICHYKLLGQADWNM